MNLPRNWTPEELDRIKALRLEGNSFGKIAKVFDTTTNTVLSVWYRKIVKATFPSDYSNHKGAATKLDEELRTRPSLPYVPGLGENQKYRLVRMSHEQLG